LPYNREVEDPDLEPKRSKPFQIFEANVLRLTALATTPHSPIAAMGDRIRQQTESATALVHRLETTINSGREGGYNSADFQKHAAPLMADLTVLNETVTNFTGLVKTRQFLGTWMIVMLATFTEAYFEDVISLLISEGLQPSSLPATVAEELKKMWVKNLLRAGKPHAWIKQLQALGVTGYAPDLADKMQKIWKRRHMIAHTADPDINNYASQEFLDALIVVNDFAEATDAFVVASYAH
jgi:hypothetical protein